jgi:hypothetical protein
LPILILNSVIARSFVALVVVSFSQMIKYDVKPKIPTASSAGQESSHGIADPRPLAIRHQHFPAELAFFSLSSLFRRAHVCLWPVSLCAPLPQLNTRLAVVTS